MVLSLCPSPPLLSAQQARAWRVKVTVGALTVGSVTSPCGCGSTDLPLVLPPIWLPVTLQKPVLFHLTFLVGKQVP